MRLRDHLIAAGLALVVMALSLTIGRGDDPTTPDGSADRVAAGAVEAAP
jgi:hypothetical protein